ncbi:Serine/threonine-protein phosphatase 4 regulatory subunit 1 [Larimichthys crocea]|uniref:Uncharacterized protein n=1 Tax=Larimichthys crocea TaxID=215358 RepID=A0ACD3RIQ2_LARCR|nr:Serine/threonine-protein phosphatase 4 regulatory subunit 1 [Larimichthys crocea]
MKPSLLMCSGRCGVRWHSPSMSWQVILGDQLTAADLVPIFNGFLKDLDEVRIGVLKHLYDFLKLLHADKRREYLYQLQEFMVTDNSRNWRFRYELAEQLILIIELYSHYDVYDYLRQIALTLCSDKVSEVRWISVQTGCRDPPEAVCMWSW